MKKRVIALTLAAAMAFTLLSGCESKPAPAVSGGTPASTGDVIKIGYLASLTGSGAYTDIPPLYAYQDYIEELNANGGLLGRQVELVAYDNTRDPTTESVTAVNKMIQQDHCVAVLGPTSSRAALTIVSLCNETKTPCISISATNEKVTVNGTTGQVEPYMFRVCFIDSYQGTALADFAATDLGLKKIATLGRIDDAYAQGILGFFESEFESKGGTIVGSLGYQTGDVEFRSQLSLAAEKGAEAIMVPATEYKDVCLIGEQANELGLEFVWLFPDGVYASELLDVGGKVLEGAYVCTGVFDDDPAYADYKDNFNKKHSGSGYTCNIYAYYALDTIELLVWAIQQAGSFEGEAIQQQLENAKDVQVFTDVLTIDPATHNPINKTISLLQIVDSKYTLYKTFKPE